MSRSLNGLNGLSVRGRYAGAAGTRVGSRGSASDLIFDFFFFVGGACGAHCMCWTNGLREQSGPAFLRSVRTLRTFAAEMAADCDVSGDGAV